MKSVFITGANRSIGLETAKQLSKQGLFVYLGTRNLEKGEALVKELNKQGFQNLKAIEIDVTKPVTVLSAKNTVEQEQGKLDILINNAGISNGFVDSALNTNAADLHQIFETNFFGAITVTQIFLDLLKKADQPRISNITSGLASLTLHGDPTWKFYPVKLAGYTTSKAALNAYTVMLAYELSALPFKVNAIDPGFTATDFNNHSGSGTVADAASFIIKHTLTDKDALTGQFFSNDADNGTDLSPW